VRHAAVEVVTLVVVVVDVEVGVVVAVEVGVVVDVELDVALEAMEVRLEEDEDAVIVGVVDAADV